MKIVPPTPFPGDVIFVRGNPIIERHQRQKGIDASDVTHVAIVADSNLVFEANISSLIDPFRELIDDEINSPNRLMTFHEWYENRPKKGDKGYYVLRPNGKLDEYIIPILDSICFFREEQYSLRTLLEGEEFPDGKSICSILVRKVLQKAELLDDTIKTRQVVLPGQLYQHLVEEKFQPIEWKDFETASKEAEHELYGLKSHCGILDAVQDAESAWGEFLRSTHGFSTLVEWDNEEKVRNFFKNLYAERRENCLDFLARQVAIVSSPVSFSSYFNQLEASHWQRVVERNSVQEAMKIAYREHLHLIFKATTGVMQLCMQLVPIYSEETRYEASMDAEMMIAPLNENEIAIMKSEISKKLAVWSDLGGDKYNFQKSNDLSPNWDVEKPDWLAENDLDVDLLLKACSVAFDDSQAIFNRYPRGFIKRITILEATGSISGIGDLLS